MDSFVHVSVEGLRPYLLPMVFLSCYMKVVPLYLFCCSLSLFRIGLQFLLKCLVATITLIFFGLTDRPVFAHQVFILWVIFFSRHCL